MACSNILAFAVLLITVLPLAAFGQNITEICNHVTCGRGTCKSGMSYAPFGFTCECDSGWRRTTQLSAASNEDQAFQFLPCVIPDCSLNSSSCSLPVESPLPSIIPTRNMSLTDPCGYAYCGEGRCEKASDYKYTCECSSGARNLLNISNFPCYRDCAFGSSCSQLGLSGTNSTTSSNSSSSNPGTTDICNLVNCGRGTCRAGNGLGGLGYTCECDSGWRKTISSRQTYEEQLLEFLPCVFPNCSMNSNCFPVAPPMPSITLTSLRNLSFTDPCAFAYCGDGTCRNASSKYTYTCECNSGSRNLLNTTYFPCYSDCAFESSCTQLGFGVNSSSTSSPDTGNASHAMLSGQLSWVVVLAVLMAFII